ncbi:MAG: glycoside hydrolase family 27 protein [Vallitaleaceae bacterium]|nr:glycoside hydrolase family 27 protein [Vallitaleaceae bacterium]
MNKNLFAMKPPMGWNSYDYYDTTVNEEQVKANADFMAKHLKESGYEYIVVDIEWYAHQAGSRREEHQYIPFEKVEMDEYGRLLPCPERFPSSIGKQGFKPLADYIHDLGLKFGIHIMRGIPRQAAYQKLPILGTNTLASEIADPSSICFWNPDMYGLRPKQYGAQEYLNSIFELYAQWGVDFIKCDDICRMDMPSAKEEIRMLQEAIQHSGRPMVLSLSPGAAKPEEAWTYETYSNMWRITDDFWDDWRLLKDMFRRCEQWQNHVKEGCYPDCDMLPVGRLGKGFGQERTTNFTMEEQKTMLSLWCIFRSPLMIGANLPDLDQETLDLLKNPVLMEMLIKGKGARQLRRNEESAIWLSEHKEGSRKYLALFNLKEEESSVIPTPFELEGSGIEELYSAKKEYMEAWSGNQESMVGTIPAHGVKVFLIE